MPRAGDKTPGLSGHYRGAFVSKDAALHWLKKNGVSKICHPDGVNWKAKYRSQRG